MCETKWRIHSYGVTYENSSIVINGWRLAHARRIVADADPCPHEKQLILSFLFILMMHIASSSPRQLGQAQLRSHCSLISRTHVWRGWIFNQKRL